MSTLPSPERLGIVTFRGAPMTLLGPELHVGQRAPGFTCVGSDLALVSLNDVLAGGTRAALLIAVPSLDTPVCNIESRRFNERLDELPKSVVAYVVSVDLPFAQTRWCGDDGDIALGMLSDYRERSFGQAYGVLVKELSLLARATFVVAPDATLRYVEIVPEIANEPNYDAALTAAVQSVPQ